jgi:hypothetical protein
MRRIHLPVPPARGGDAAQSNDFDRFLLAYHQEVFDLFMSLRTQPSTDSHNTHFLILETEQKHYVQCLLYDNDAEADCEVASGLWLLPPRIALSPAAQGKVARQGFAIKNNQGNYQRDISDTASPQRIWDLTDLMLEMLYEAYTAKIGDVYAVFPMLSL